MQVVFTDNRSLITGNWLLLLSLVLEHHRQKYADNRHNQAAQEGRPETVHGETNVEVGANNPCQPEQEGVDQEREQTQGQDDQRTGENLEQRAQKRIKQPKDQRQPDEG